ncbi:MAG: alpha-L-fucosidase [Clostridia bacterium]|nr:alpha-L-fucosidase [Clostridia bacterium]
MENKFAYIEKFKRYGFGMFVHFGIYSVIGQGEWALNILNVDSNINNKVFKYFFAYHRFIATVFVFSS